MNGAKELLKQRDYLLGLAGNLCSATAECVIFLALLARVYETTHSSANLGVTAMLEALPAIALAPFVGLLLDRVDRRHVMVAADLFNVLAVVALSCADSLGVTYACAFVLAVGGACFLPANQAMQPALLPRELYHAGACFRTSAQNVRQIVAPALGGYLVSQCGFAFAVRFAAVGYLLSAVFSALIRVSGRPEPHDGVQAGWMAEALAGWQVVRDRAPVRFMVTFQAMIVFTMAMQAPLVYVFCKEVLGRGPEVAGPMFSAAGLGGIAGGLAMARWGAGVKDRLGLAMLTLAFDGLVLAAFTLCRTPAHAIPLFSLFGIVGAVNGVVYNTLIQEEVPDRLRGRVQGSLVMLYRTVELLSLTVGTLAADRFGVVAVFLTCAALELVVALGARYLPSYQVVEIAASPA